MLTPLQQQLLQVRATLPQDVELVAVSKFHPVEALQEAYDAGQRIFGESRVQELEQKRPLMPADTRWHFIGHLQANKVKYIAPYVELIHAVDSLKLLIEIDRQAARCGRIIHCLLQVHVAQENTKYGFLPNELFDFLERRVASTFQYLFSRFDVHGHQYGQRATDTSRVPPSEITFRASKIMLFLQGAHFLPMLLGNER